MYTGAIQDKKDKRDYQYSEVIAGSALFDWSKGYDVEVEIGEKLHVKNQGQSYSCGGQAMSYYGAVLNKVFDNVLEERSAKFIYSQVFEPNGGGSGMRKLNDLVANKGWGTEVLTTSYQNGAVPSEAFMRRVEDITEQAYEVARHDKALSYFNVDINVESIALAVSNNHGAILGVTGSNNGTWRSAYPKPPLFNGEEIWNHWVYIGKLKMINGVRYFGVINSWGEEVGEKGWQWLSEDYIKKQYCIFACWTLVYNTQTNAGFNHTFNFDMEYKGSGNIKSEVEALQKALQIDGVYPKTVPITGNYFDITRQAVYDFQIKYKVAPFWVLWFNKGKYVSTATRKQLNLLFSK